LRPISWQNASSAVRSIHFVLLYNVAETMPKIYRAMKVDEHARPVLGPRDLGVRIRPDDSPDIEPDEANRVRPGKGGMSVTPSLLTLPDSRIPKRLRHLVPGARGSNTISVWSMGQGAFEMATIADGLILRPDPEHPMTHGFVEPGDEMPLETYQEALAATQGMWQIDEQG